VHLPFGELERKQDAPPVGRLSRPEHPPLGGFPVGKLKGLALVLTSLPTEYVTSSKMLCKPLGICGKVTHTVPKVTNLGSESNESGFRK